MASGGNRLHDAVEETCKRAHELLKCRVCTTSMSPPNYECQNGHLVCSICKIQVQSSCAECGVDIGDTRCLFMEKVSNLLKGKHPCYDCPYNTSECLVKGNPPQFVKHLKEDHNVDMHYGSEFAFDYVQSHSQNQMENENTTGMLQVINCYGWQFCLYFEPCLLGEVPCYIAFVLFTGEDSEAQTFKCSLDIGASNSPSK
ncbi:E3 ubiquitin protein ligase SINAT2 [Tanacetum coccineum]